MPFALRMGQPEMKALWQDLSTRQQAGCLGKDEEKFFKKLVKVLGCLSADPPAQQSLLPRDQRPEPQARSKDFPA